MIYLDNASTTYPKPPAVIEAMQRFMTELGANPGRGGYRASTEASQMVADVRQKLTQLVNGDDPSHMVFTASCTDALNMAIHGVLRDGDHVVTTALEHNSVNRPLEARVRAGSLTVARVPFDADGLVDPEDIKRALKTRTQLVVLNHASNVTGTIQPAREIGRLAHEHGALFLLDAAQTIGMVDIDVAGMHVDMLAFPAHKELLGPPGLGGLYVANVPDIKPWRQGGTGADAAYPVQPTDWPTVLEAGTPNAVGIAGLRAALDEIEPASMLAHVRRMLVRFYEGIARAPGVRPVAGTDTQNRVGTVPVVVEGMSPQEVVAIMDESFGICVRGGMQCAPHTHRLLGTFPEGTVRVSPGPFTTEDEIDRAASALVEIAAG